MAKLRVRVLTVSSDLEHHRIPEAMIIRGALWIVARTAPFDRYGDRRPIGRRAARRVRGRAHAARRAAAAA